MNNIVLFEPEIPGNTGNIMRTCVATNTKLHLIKPLGFSLDESHLKRSAVNYIENLNYEVYENYEDFKSKNKGTYYYFTRYGKKPHTSFDYSNTKEDIYLREDLDRCMRIPMTDKVRALNLSNCAAIVIYEVLRQQNYEGLLFKEPHKSEDFIIE